MPTTEQVIESLEAVLVPAVKRSIAGMNPVREVTTSDKKGGVTLAPAGLVPGAQDWLRTRAKDLNNIKRYDGEIATKRNLGGEEPCD